MIIQKKRQVLLALFLCLLFCSFSYQADADVLCQAEGKLEQAQVKYVVDGDTVYLTDGRKVRLAGINTPELDHKHAHHEPYAVEARERLKALAGKTLFIQVAKDPRDHYGRYLYYLFNKDRISLASQLLFEGLGYRVAIPPNLAYQACFQKAEQHARRERKGVWQQTLQWQPKAGFVMARLTITSITQNRGGWWLETNQDLVINLPSYTSDYWPAQKVFSLQDHEVEVRGWQHQRNKQGSKPWVLLVKHPNDLLVDPNVSG